MRNIPMFTTEFGIASLYLQEIPYNGKAYVRIRSTQMPAQLLEECVGFCRACGAEIIFATGDEYLEKYPVSAVLLRLRCLRSSLPDTDAMLFPVLPEHGDHWRRIYNEKIAGIDNAAYMDGNDLKQMLAKGDGYFVHRDGRLIGIGCASGDTVDFLAATEKGAGRDVLAALASLLTEDTVSVTVAESNCRAMTLYQRLGFVPVEEVDRWYRIMGGNGHE